MYVNIEIDDRPSTLLDFTTSPEIAYCLDMELVGAFFIGHCRYSLKVLSDCYSGRLYVYGNEHGAMYVVRATSFDSAWELITDDMPTIPDDEVHEAYGLDTAEELAAKSKKAMLLDEGWPELTEGYDYQANAEGTGIVEHGYYAWMHELTDNDSILPIFEWAD